MNFDLEEDQRALVNTVERLVAKEYTFEQRQRYAELPNGWSPDVWDRLAEIGVMALPFSEHDGGLGGGPADFMLAMQSLGKAALLEPFVSSIVLCGSILKRGTIAEVRSHWIPQLCDGSLRLAFAHAEPGSRHGMEAANTCARRDGDTWLLVGSKRLVLHGDSADGFFVSARIQSVAGHSGVLGIFHVNADAEGLQRKSYALLDGTRCADLQLNNVSAQSMVIEGAQEVLENVWCDAASAVCWDSIGSMQALLDLTVDYLKTRRQFGRAIGSFQVLQHRAVDMLMALEQSRSMAMYAAMTCDGSLEERQRSISATKIQICDSSRFIAQQAIQLHGGIGMTQEYQVGHYVRRLLVLESLFGDREFHLSRLSRTDGVFSR
ncbi:acyl-CoA dehydrogenase family protein [Alcaligenaceae bacterium]|nr:acyl-CoA dehydrogenase family protein [Alcaligenaceae bacterium]